jgi:spermidine synthase
LPDIRVDVVDIEPALVELGKVFFRVPDDPRLTHYIEDGRRFLHDTTKKYDLIFLDVYVSSIPAHFATKEFFEIAKGKLETDGILIANVVGDLSPSGPSFVFAEMKTFQSAFEHAYFFAVESPTSQELQNFIFAGHASERRIDFEGSEFQEKLINPKEFDLSRYSLLEDNFAPVEYLYAQTWRRRLAEGQ